MNIKKTQTAVQNVSHDIQISKTQRLPIIVMKVVDWQ